jgi:hypothetical protein
MPAKTRAEISLIRTDPEPISAPPHKNVAVSVTLSLFPKIDTRLINDFRFRNAAVGCYLLTWVGSLLTQNLGPYLATRC